MTNQNNRYEVCHREGFSNCDDMASAMLHGVETSHSNKASAIKAMKQAEQQAPEVAKRMGAPRIAVWDNQTQEYVA